ncbi:hypothetical protein C0992_002148 [Termitomyces sp. T32_za158]|nr:hypothetical protein C0992_002148 [Termitomyces sp. T32_za158]
MPPAQPRPAPEPAVRNAPSDSTLSSKNRRSQMSFNETSICVYGPTLPFLENAGILGPIPEGFDFEGRTIMPDGISRFGLPLGIRIQRNVEIERYNERKLVNSQTLCDSLGPLAPSLIRQITAARAKGKKEAELARQAEKEKEKEVESSLWGKLMGTMEMQKPVRRAFGEAKEIVIPTIYLLNIRNRLIPPLHFFTNSCIELVHTSPQIIHTKFVRPYGVDEQSGDKVQLLDLGKMINLWGNDDTNECLSPLRFLEASKNLLAALRLLCKAPTESLEDTAAPTNNSTNYAIEYERHLTYFKH